MLYDTLVLPLFMAAAGLWVAILGPTTSAEEPETRGATMGQLGGHSVFVLRHFLATGWANTGHASLADQTGE